MIAILRQACSLYQANALVIAACLACLWLPFDVLISYLTHFVFDGDDWRSTAAGFRSADNLVGLIATAAVISVANASLSGQRLSLAQGVHRGLIAWLRMWWTRLVSRLVLLIAFLFLVVPGLWLLVRFSLTESVVVCERVSGPAALSRSFELTRGHFRRFFWLQLVTMGIVAATLVCSVGPPLLIPELDHWLYFSAIWFMHHFVTAYVSLAFFAAFTALTALPYKPRMLDVAAVTENYSAPFHDADSDETWNESLPAESTSRTDPGCP